MAQRLYRYLDASHADAKSGGWIEASDSEGKPCLEGEGTDAIGTPYGQLSQNTHLHLLEAITELHRVWPDPYVASDLRTLIQILASDLKGESGHLCLFVDRDWRPTSTDVSYGHDIEAAHLLIDAARQHGAAPPNPVYDDTPDADRAIRALGESALAEGWDLEAGGLFYAGDASGPTDRTKNWWAQAEALLGFAALWRYTGEARYAEALAQEWAFIRDHQIDRVQGGWFEEASRTEMAKGHAWKAAYHDGRALLFTARLLRENPL